MLIKNNSKRLYTIAGVMVVPNGQAIEVPCTEADIAGLDDLEVVKAKAPKEDSDEPKKPGRPAKAKEDDAE